MSGSVDATAEPNLTPILDMVFQLITFFMLLMNFKSNELDQDLTLPVVGSARPVDMQEGDFLVLNVTRDGKLVVQGHERPRVVEFLASEGVAAQLVASRSNSRFKPGDDLPTTVVIRADRDTRFHFIYKIVKTCQEKGFRKFNYMAKSEVKEPGS